jgi:hypothetical protein
MVGLDTASRRRAAAALTTAIASRQAVSIKIENHHEKTGGRCMRKAAQFLVGSSRALGCWKARQVERSTGAEIENRFTESGGPVMDGN